MKLLLTFLSILTFQGIVNAQDDILYSFFVAGHTYGSPGVDNVGLHPPFKAKFGYIQNRTEIQFGVFTGDIVNVGTVQNWDEVDADIEELGLPVYFAVGNHDMTNRPLFEERYGITYFSFIFENDLFIVLDPNIDSWNISGEQLAFLEETVELNSQDVENIFVFFHQLLWRESDNIYSVLSPNSYEGRADTINFWSEIEPLFNNLTNEVFMFCGDMGAGSWASDVAYDNYDNISLIGSGMGDINGENFIVVNVLNDKSVSYDLLCLSDVENCLGELTDYQLTVGIDEFISHSPKLEIYPNPTSDFINIELQWNEKSELNIYSLNGKRVLTESLFGETTTIIDVRNLSKGLYIGTVKSNSKIHNFRLIIQ